MPGDERREYIEPSPAEIYFDILGRLTHASEESTVGYKNIPRYATEIEALIKTAIAVVPASVRERNSWLDNPLPITELGEKEKISKSALFSAGIRALGHPRFAGDANATQVYTRLYNQRELLHGRKP